MSRFKLMTFAELQAHPLRHQSIFKQKNEYLLEVPTLAKPILGLVLLQIEILSDTEHKHYEAIQNLLNELSGLTNTTDNYADILENYSDKIDELLKDAGEKSPYQNVVNSKALKTEVFIQLLFDTTFYLSMKLPENEWALTSNMMFFLRKNLGDNQSDIYRHIKSSQLDIAFDIKLATTIFKLVYYSDTFCKAQNTQERRESLYREVSP